MIKRRLGFAGILLAGLILVLYLTGGGKIFGRLGVSRCEKLWKESEEVMVEGEVYQKTRKEEKLILYLKKIQIREMGNGKAVADERLLVYLDEKGNGPEIGQRILVEGNVGFFDPAANPGNFDQKNYYKQQMPDPCRPVKFFHFLFCIKRISQKNRTQNTPSTLSHLSADLICGPVPKLPQLFAEGSLFHLFFQNLPFP